MIMIHSVLPIAYFIIYYLYFGGVELPDSLIVQYFWYSLIALAVVLPIGASFLIHYYRQNNWQNHPIAKTLAKYSNTPNNPASWTIVASEINTEYRRNDKLIKRFSAITKIIVTENWIIKTALYFVHFAHQSDSALIAVGTDTHNISINDTNDAAQFVNIEVKPTREGTRSFKIRINSLDFKDLQDRVNRPITVSAKYFCRDKIKFFSKRTFLDSVVGNFPHLDNRSLYFCIHKRNREKSSLQNESEC